MTGDSDRAAATRSPAETAAGVPFGEALKVWLKIGLLSFGGPAGQIALMHRILVEERGWIGERRFLNALNFCMLLPGPEAMQLATYVGWRLHRTLGGLAAGLLFVLPGAAVILALSILYAAFHRLPAVDALFYGVKPAVAAIVVEALFRIGRRALISTLHAGVALAAFLGIFFFDLPFPLIVLAAAIVGFCRPRAFAPGGEPDADGADAKQPALRRTLGKAAIWLGIWLVPVGLLCLRFGAGPVYATIAVFFSQMAVVTFGGAYAVLAYVAQEAVGNFGWLSPGEMVDGLGLAETTPGPLILVLQFVGFMAAYRAPGALDPILAGGLGAAVTLWVTFTPCFLWILVGAPYIDALGRIRAFAGALGAITAAVAGVIANLTVWFALHVLFREVSEQHWHGLRLVLPHPASLDPVALLLTAAAAFALMRLRFGMLATLAATAAAGALWHALLGSF
jgi:chromate transporter